MSRAKRTGTDWESRCAALYTRALGTPVRRLAQHGSADLGDLDGVYGHAVECKAHRTWDVLDWVRQARREAANKAVPFYVVLAKRPRLSIQDCLAISDIQTHARLVARLCAAEDALRVADPATYRRHLEAHGR